MSSFPVLTILILIFIIWLQYELRKSSRTNRTSSDRFWERETDSNHVRRKDISNLDYLTIKPELLPLDDKNDQTINSYRDTILQLAERKILNLTGVTNTELKNAYGAANINLLTDYDNNYAILVSMLQKWAERLYSEGYTEDALSVLSYAVSCKTDVTKTYKLLAELYIKQNKPEKVNELIQIVTGLEVHDKDKLLQELKALLP